MPLQVVGQRAEEDVTSDSIIGLVVDGPDFELHGLAAVSGVFDFAVFAIGRTDEADRITAVALNFEMKGERFASNGHQISTLNSNNQAKTTQCMATNEIQNGCESSIEAVLASNHKRRCD